MSDKLCGNRMFIAGNIDQAQYCERIKGIIELLGSKLSLDELSKIWRIQVRPNNTHTHTSPLHDHIDSLCCFFQAGQSSTVIENIHTIIAAAAVKFSFDQLTHLFVLIQKVVSRSGLKCADRVCVWLGVIF